MCWLKKPKHIIIPLDTVNVTVPRKSEGDGTPSAYISITFKGASDLNSYMTSIRPMTINPRNKGEWKHITLCYVINPDQDCLNYFDSLAPRLRSILADNNNFDIWGLSGTKAFINGQLVNELMTIREEIKAKNFNGVVEYSLMHISH